MVYCLNWDLPSPFSTFLQLTSGQPLGKESNKIKEMIKDVPQRMEICILEDLSTFLPTHRFLIEVEYSENEESCHQIQWNWPVCKQHESSLYNISNDINSLIYCCCNLLVWRQFVLPSALICSICQPCHLKQEN